MKATSGTSGGLLSGKTLYATSWALSLTCPVVGSPVKTAAKVAAKALGLLSLPVRLAVAALSVTRSVGRARTPEQGGETSPGPG